MTYAEHGHAGTSKERLEILGRGRSVVIDDFTRLEIDGKDVKLTEPGKGHAANLRLFREAVAGPERRDADFRATIATTAAALAAARSLQDGALATVDPRVSTDRFR